MTGIFWCALLMGVIAALNSANGGRISERNADLTADDWSHIKQWHVTTNQYLAAKGLIDDETIAAACFVEVQAQSILKSRDDGSKGLAWQLIDGHTVFLSSDNLETQDALGAWSKLHYFCTYDLNTKRVVKVEEADRFFRANLGTPRANLHMRLIP